MLNDNQFKMFDYYVKQIVSCEFFTSLLHIRRVIANSMLINVTERDLLIRYCDSCEKYKK